MPDPPARIVDRDHGAETPLYNIQQNMANRKSSPSVDAVYSNDSDETFVVTLEEQTRLQINGTASAFRIANSSDFDNDPLTALAEYACLLLAHVNANQGVGWTVENDYTGRTLNCVIEEVEVVYTRGEKYQFDYSIGARVGDGLQRAEPLSPRTADPSTTARLAGQDLHEIEEMMISKKQKMKTTTYALGDIEANEVESLSGSRRMITIRGNIPGDESDRLTFDNAIREPIGNNETVMFESPFPGPEYEVAVVSHDATREAGKTQIGKYNTEVVEGIVQ